MKKLTAWISAVTLAVLFVVNPQGVATAACKKLPLGYGVSAGFQNSFAWDNKGSAWAWGRGDYGQRGVGLDTLALRPLKISSLKNVVQISSGNLHTLFLTNDGSVFSSGDSEVGQLGQGSKAYTFTPKRVVIPACVIKVFAAVDSSFALDSSGSIWAWGDNSDGVLGLPEEWVYNKPKKISMPPVQDMWISGVFSLAKTKTGAFWFWGWGAKNVFGIADSKPVMLPESLNLTSFKGFAFDAERSIAIKQDSENFAIWGYTRFGYPEAPSFDSNPRVPSDLKASMVFVQSDVYAALTKSGDLYTWGVNEYGALGSGAETWCAAWEFPEPPCLGWDLVNNNHYTAYPNPTRVLTGIKRVALGPKHGLAVDSKGIVWSWGSGAEGQLGTGAAYNKHKPVKVMNLDLIR